MDAKHVNKFLGLVFSNVKFDEYVRGILKSKESSMQYRMVSHFHFIVLADQRSHDHRLFESQSKGGQSYRFMHN